MKKKKEEKGEQEKRGRAVKGEKAEEGEIEPKCPTERENKWELGASSLKKSLRLESDRNKPDKLVRLSKSTQ